MDIEAREGTAPEAETFAFPLTFQQQRLWFLEQYEPGTALYNIPTGARLAGPLDAGRFARAFDAVVDRHEALRTVFRVVDGEPLQLVGPGVLPRMEVVEAPGVDPERRDAEARKVFEREGRRPLDLETGPLVRALLVRFAPDDHAVILVIHHIVADGWSLGILVRELWAFYGALGRGEPAPLPELELQYADVAVWQRETLQGEAIDAEVAWWKAQLEGAPAALELPTDRPRPARQETAGGETHRFVPAPLAASLRELARREEATLYMVLVAGLDVLLSRYAGSDEVLVGTPVANRTMPEVEGLIGLFANTLVLRVRMGGDPTFREVLGRVRDASLAAQDHQDVPFEKLVEELKVERDLSRAPLFQVMVVLQNAGQARGMDSGEVRMRAIVGGNASAKFDLYLAVNELSDGSLLMVLEYATALFDAATAERMLEHLHVLLAAAAADPGARVRDLPLMGGDERKRLVEGWNATDRDLPAGPVHEQVAARAAADPSAVAVVAPDATLTYGELEARANRLARHLRSLGAGPGARVALAIERSAEMVVGLLAILKTGAAYLPVDPDFPADRVAYMLADSGVRLLLARSSGAEVLPVAEGVTVVRTDADAEAIAAWPAGPVACGVGDDDLAYVIYTSGSTGRPKGVQVRHGGVAAFLGAMREAPGLAAGETLVAVTTLSFDIAVLEIFLPLVVGATTVVATREEAADPVRIREILERTGATAMQATPATWRMLVASGWTPPPSLKLLCGGEALPRELAGALRAGGAELWNLYGPTETTVWSTALRVEGEGPVRIGGPIAGTRVYVVDRHGVLTPTGVPGELCIGGRGVARGYLGRPAMTAERFVPDPFSARPGARMYRTGDRARWLAEGTLEFLGRLDTQVKLRGFRIELGEIEAVLREHPGVAEAAAVVREDVPGDARLVAYVVARGEAPPAAELRALLRTRVPEYMVPGAFVPLERLPLTPNGKVDRKALPAPDALSSDESAYVAPRTPTEEMLAGLWAELLRVGRVGVNDSFFELGGHSLLATQVMARLRQQTGITFPVRVLFEARTVAELAKRVDEAKEAPAQGPRLKAASRAAFRVRLTEDPAPAPATGD